MKGMRKAEQSIDAEINVCNRGDWSHLEDQLLNLA